MDQRHQKLLGSRNVQSGMATEPSKHPFHRGRDTLKGRREGGREGGREGEREGRGGGNVDEVEKI